MPRYQKLGVWCTRGRFSIRNPPLFLRSGNCGTTGHAAATIFRNFQCLLRNALTSPPLPFSLSLSLYLPFRLIYRLEQISERDTTIEINPCELGDRFIRVLTIAIPVIAIYIYIYKTGIKFFAQRFIPFKQNNVHCVLTVC